MNKSPCNRVLAAGALLLLSAALVVLAGCPSLCTKRLYLHRDTPEKSAPASRALLLTNPGLARAALASPPANLEAGLPWAPEQAHYDSDCYRLTVVTLDNVSVYQGQCLDTKPTEVCEVRPGVRQVRLRLELMGPWGRRSLTEDVKLDLAAGSCYYLYPEWDALTGKRFVPQVVPVTDRYTPEVRARVLQWLQTHVQGAHTLE